MVGWPGGIAPPGHPTRRSPCCFPPGKAWRERAAWRRSPGPAGQRPGAGPSSRCRRPRPRPAPAELSAPACRPPWPATRSPSGRPRPPGSPWYPRAPGRCAAASPGRPGQQRLVQPGHRIFPAPGSQLHQRRGMRHLGIQRDPAEPPPGDRVANLSAQALLAQPVPELQKHQPQIALHRRGRPAQHQVEVRYERGEERRVI